jgi:hypothetical protein
MIFMAGSGSGTERELNRFGPYTWPYVGTTTGYSDQTITHNLGTKSLQVVIYMASGGYFVAYDYYQNTEGGHPGTSHRRGYQVTMLNDNQIRIRRYHLEEVYQPTYYVDIYKHEEKVFTN